MLVYSVQKQKKKKIEIVFTHYFVASVKPLMSNLHFKVYTYHKQMRCNTLISIQQVPLIIKESNYIPNYTAEVMSCINRTFVEGYI